MRQVFVALAMVASMYFVTDATAATVSPGYVSGTINGDAVGLRYRSQSTGREIFVGKNDLSTGANRSEAEYGWTPGSLAFSFVFDGLTGQVTSTLGTTVTSYASGFNMEAFVLKLTLANRSKNTGTFAVNGLSVNGQALGNFTSTNYTDWTVTGFTVAPLLTVTGTLVHAGLFDKNDSERVKFEVTAGLREISAVPVPAALPLMLAGLGGLAFVARRRKAA